ncbi:MAG: PorP/SprF family type IX secretion system membrane protein [Saprospiraceae bacterium]
MNKKIFLFFLYLGLAGSLISQDQHFTQFYASPISLNPALTGALEGKYRFSVIYRDQWKNVLQNPFITYSGAIDFRFRLSQFKKKQDDAFGVGVIFNSDKVPFIGYSNNQVFISGGFHKSLSDANDQFLSIGGQVGLAQRNISYGNINFEDQFNGDNGYTNSTDETLPENNFAHADFNVGINYAYAPQGKLGVFIGGSMFHLSEPSIGFYYDKEKPEKYPEDQLATKYVGHLSFQIPIADRVQMLPRALIYSQGPHLAINAGTNFRFLADDIKGVAIHLGAWVRPVKNEQDIFFMDAVVGMVGLELNNFLLGISYDANLNDINQTRKGQGAFEISIAYLGEYDDETVLCPKF